ncbi:uncharacterized protein LOC124807774 isoform X8 [Hydra vulgaris]|uniref:uncharacterized protein LOC124807774 isoform X8 n=1 Tax=Hydra vulgaris TaxID=6087 RepID=UPI0032E9DA52
MNNINELGNQTDTSSSSDAVVLSTSASDKFFQICIELMSKSKLFWLIFLPLALSPSAMVDAGLQFHQFLRFLQSTQPSTVPSTSETVAASTSAFVGWSSTTNLLYLMASHKTCCTCLQATKLAVSICSLATWYWAEGGRLTPPSMKSIYTPLVTIFTIFQPYSRFNKETCLL